MAQLASPTRCVILSGCSTPIGAAVLSYLTLNHSGVTIKSADPFSRTPSRLKGLLTGEPVDHLFFINCVEQIDGPASTVFDVNIGTVVRQLDMIHLYAPGTRYLSLTSRAPMEAGGSKEKYYYSPFNSSKRAARDVIHSYAATYGLAAQELVLPLCGRLNEVVAIHVSSFLSS